MAEFADRSVLVTGAGGRIGRATAVQFARAGARVGLFDLREDTVAASLRAVRDAGGTAEPFVGDVASLDDVVRVVDAHERTVGPTDVLVNAAGVYPNRPVLEMGLDEWDRVFAVNVRGTMLCCQAVARRMVARGTPGVLINCSSGASKSARAGSAHYCGSKAAVNLFTHCLAIELGPHGIRVNAVAPGLVLDRVYTPGDRHESEYVNLMVSATPLRRSGTPDDIASAILFLAGPRAPWTTGAILEVSGGTHCGRTHVPLSPNLRG